MINITSEKQRLFPLYAQKYCGIQDRTLCTKDRCDCELLAELHAFRNCVIPSGYRKFNVSDFTGQLSDGSVLDDIIALKAKHQVCDYCYGKGSLEKIKKINVSDLYKLSIIDQRIENGSNVIIHGDSTRILKDSMSSNNRFVKEKPLGRTFIASVLTKEALNLSIDSKHHTRHFDWIDFSQLTRLLKSSNKKDEVESQYYEECDWLVIDDITDSPLLASPAQKSWLEPVYDAFFSTRYKSGLVTIFVFRFDINRRRSELESAFGVNITKVIDDPSSFVIGLTSERKDND